MIQWRRKKWEIEANLYPENEIKILGIAFRTLQGEIEIEGYEDNKAEIEIKLFGLKIPDNSTVSLVIDNKRILDFQINHGRYKKEHIEVGGHSSDFTIGSKVEIQYMGKTLLSGTFREDK